MAYVWEHAYDLLVGGAVTIAVTYSQGKLREWRKRRLPYENGRREEIVRSYRELARRNPEMAADLVIDLVNECRRKATEEEDFNRKVIQRLRSVGGNRED